MLLLAALTVAYLGFALLALGQARHAETVAAAPPRPHRALAAGLLMSSLGLVILREGWAFGVLLWATLVILAALAVVATLTWRPGWLRPLATRAWHSRSRRLGAYRGTAGPRT